LKKTFKIFGYVLLILVAFIGCYAIAAYSLSRMGVEKERTSDAQNIPIYILTNGVHTDIVMPVKNEIIDWSKVFNYENTKGQDTLAEFIAMGWGDKGFYLETPEWSDLKFSVAFKAAFGLSHSAIHTSFYSRLQEDSTCKRINISPKQYERLVDYVKKSLDFDEKGNTFFIKTDAVYGVNDAFYEAGGSYHLFHTCNTWSNNALKSCGQKASVWTPFDTGIFYQYR
jgi:uncharacterized protein (TIGR02117 family)